MSICLKSDGSLNCWSVWGIRAPFRVTLDIDYLHAIRLEQLNRRINLALHDQKHTTAPAFPKEMIPDQS